VTNVIDFTGVPGQLVPIARIFIEHIGRPGKDPAYPDLADPFGVNLNLVVDLPFDGNDAWCTAAGLGVEPVIIDKIGEIGEGIPGPWVVCGDAGATTENTFLVRKEEITSNNNRLFLSLPARRPPRTASGTSTCLVVCRLIPFIPPPPRQVPVSQILISV